MKCPYCGKELPKDILEPEKREIQHVEGDKEYTAVESIYPDVWLHYSHYKDYFKG